MNEFAHLDDAVLEHPREMLKRLPEDRGMAEHTIQKLYLDRVLVRTAS